MDTNRYIKHAESAINSKMIYEKLATVAQAFQNTQNFVISNCRFEKDCCETNRVIIHIHSHCSANKSFCLVPFSSGVAVANFPFRKRSMPFLTVDDILGNQAFQNRRCHISFSLGLGMVNQSINQSINQSNFILRGWHLIVKN